MTDERLAAERFAAALAAAVPGVDALRAAQQGFAAIASALTASDQLGLVLANPVVPAAAKQKVLVELAKKAGADKTTLAAVNVLAQHEGYGALAHLPAALAKVIDDRSGIHEARVATAAPLDEALRARLAAALEKVVGGKVRLVETVDAELLGGVVVEVGGTLLDGSVKTRLAKMRQRLAAGAQ